MRAVDRLAEIPQRVPQLFRAAFLGEERDRNGPIGVVGVGRISGEAFALPQLSGLEKLSFFLSLLAGVNLVLFLFNLLPIYPLDGGHVAAALWESIRRGFAKLFQRREPGPVDAAKLMPLTFLVVIVLGGMSALLIFADIVKPVNLFG